MDSRRKNAPGMPPGMELQAMQPERPQVRLTGEELKFTVAMQLAAAPPGNLMPATRRALNLAILRFFLTESSEKDRAFIRGDIDAGVDGIANPED